MVVATVGVIPVIFTMSRRRVPLPVPVLTVTVRVFVLSAPVTDVILAPVILPAVTVTAKLEAVTPVAGPLKVTMNCTELALVGVVVKRLMLVTLMTGAASFKSLPSVGLVVNPSFTYISPPLFPVIPQGYSPKLELSAVAPGMASGYISVPVVAGLVYFTTL